MKVKVRKKPVRKVELAVRAESKKDRTTFASPKNVLDRCNTDWIDINDCRGLSKIVQRVHEEIKALHS